MPLKAPTSDLWLYLRPSSERSDRPSSIGFASNLPPPKAPPSNLQPGAKRQSRLPLQPLACEISARKKRSEFHRALSLPCPVKYIENMERNEFNRATSALSLFPRFLCLKRSAPQTSNLAPNGKAVCPSNLPPPKAPPSNLQPGAKRQSRLPLQPTAAESAALCPLT